MNETRPIVFSLLLIFTLYVVDDSSAQGIQPGMGGHLWPESIELVSLSGTVRIDEQGVRPMYSLDIDADGLEDYRIDFGPWWYLPNSGATRPMDGESISVEGDVKNGQFPPVLTVFTLNQQTWRVANEYGAAGWLSESIWSSPGDAVTVTGVVLVDTSYFYHHLYLDTNSDGMPEYQLGLGPMWYKPDGNTQWPVEGSTVEVNGWLRGGPAISMLVVLSLDGEIWRSASDAAPWAGSWMVRNHTDEFIAYCVTDTTSSISFPQDHMSGMMGMNSWPDSSFVQFWNVHPDSLPGIQGGDTFMGFYVNTQNPTGDGMMGGTWGGRIGMIRYSQTHVIRLHYSEDDLTSHGLTENGIMLHWWDSAGGVWRNAETMQHDGQANTVSLASNDLAQYYRLSASATVTGLDPQPVEPSGFVLYQNYPNPFNPTTTITFDVPERQRVVLSIYDLLGRTVAIPADRIFDPGTHRISLDAGMFATGSYLYRLAAGQSVRSRILTVVR